MEKRSPFEDDHARAADVARDLNVPPIVATHYGIICPACGRMVGTYANGKIRPHYATDRAALCSGAYSIPATTREDLPAV